MQVKRRTIVALGTAAVIFALAGCGGLGVNIGSGPSRASSVVNRVSIQVQSGVNIPNVTLNKNLLLVAIAYYGYGGNQYVSSTQGATWTKFIGAPFTGDISLFNSDCITPYTGTVTQNLCVRGDSTGTAQLTATVAGFTTGVTVTVL